MNKKIIIFVTAMVLVLAMATGATFAYLFSSASVKTNTFLPSYIGDPSVSEDATSFVVVPGVPITKDPEIKYTPDSRTKNVGTVILYATIEVESAANVATWAFSSNTFTLSSVNSTAMKMSFTVNTDNWVYVGKAGSQYVYAYKAVLDGTSPSASFGVIKDDTVSVTANWSESRLKEVFSATTNVKVNIGSFVAQAKLNSTETVAVGNTVDATKAKAVWDACASAAIS